MQWSYRHFEKECVFCPSLAKLSVFVLLPGHVATLFMSTTLRTHCCVFPGNNAKANGPQLPLSFIWRFIFVAVTKAKFCAGTLF